MYDFILEETISRMHFAHSEGPFTHLDEAIIIQREKAEKYF